MTRRTGLVMDLRSARNGIETEYDRLRDAGFSTFTSTQIVEAMEHMRQALLLLQEEIEQGESHLVFLWPAWGEVKKNDGRTVETGHRAEDGNVAQDATSL